MAKSVVTRATGYEKMCIPVTLAILADGIKLPTYMILNSKIMPKDQLPTGITIRCQPKGWMTNEAAVCSCKDVT
jgi:hypothetical protein